MKKQPNTSGSYLPASSANDLSNKFKIKKVLLLRKLSNHSIKQERQTSLTMPCDSYSVETKAHRLLPVFSNSDTI